MDPITGNFPPGFLMGASTAGHQVEGGNIDQWTAWEFDNAERLAIEASPTKDYGNGHPMPGDVWQMVEKRAKDPGNYLSGVACDHYNRFEEDLDLAAELGLNAYRFSIEWSRIEPSAGVVDEAEIDHYRRVIRACQVRGIKPIVCLWHWCHPPWFEREGAWLNECAPWMFAQYARAAVSRLADAGVDQWLVLNEPDVFNLLGYGPKWAKGGVWPPSRGSYRNFNRVARQLIECHKRGYDLIHEHVPGSTVSSAVNLTYNESARDPLSWGVKSFVGGRMWEFHEATRGHQDYVGLNYYMHQVYRGMNPFGGQRDDAWRSDLGWELCPEGLYHVLMQIKERMPGKPVFITEHGVADCRDMHRARYIRESLGFCLAAIRDGVDLRGYLHWTLLDNFEWDKGFFAQFGLIDVDRETLERFIRPSAREYARIIAANAL